MAKKETNTDKEYPLWTVMVYLAGDNNLTDESVYAVTEMKQVNTAGNIAVIAQLDPRASRIPTHRYVINPGAKSGASAVTTSGALALVDDVVSIQKPTVKAPKALGSATGTKAVSGETDTGDPRTLFDFISWSKQEHPAQHYAVILAGHGAGTEEDFLLKDENPTNSLRMRDLQGVFRAVKEKLHITVDILGMDVCLMSMAEVCLELKGYVKYLVGSEGYSPTAGWPYRQILEAWTEKLKTNPKTTPREMATTIVDEYIEFYTDYVVGGLSVDQSVLDVSASAGLAGAVKELATKLKGELKHKSFRDAVVLAHWEAQSYNGELFVDLWDFCDLLETRYTGGGVPKACAKVKTEVDQMTGKSSCFSGVENQFSNGVSIYFPWAEVMPSYRELDFAMDSGADWNSFLDSYVKETRRLPRGDGPGSKVLLDFPGQKPLKFSALIPGDSRFRKARDRKASDRGLNNPIQSMRNPPITLVEAGLSRCQAKPDIVRRLRRLSGIRRQP